MKKLLMLLTLTIGLLSCEVREMKIPRKESKQIGDMMALAYNALGEKKDNVSQQMEKQGYKLREEREDYMIYYSEMHKRVADYTIILFFEDQMVFWVDIYRNMENKEKKVYSVSDTSLTTANEQYMLFSDALSLQPWQTWSGRTGQDDYTQSFDTREDFIANIDNHLKTATAHIQESVNWRGAEERKSCVLSMWRYLIRDFDRLNSNDDDDVNQYYNSEVIGFTQQFKIDYRYQLPVKKIWFNTESFSTLLKYDIDLVKIQAQPKLNADYGYFSTIEFSSSDESIFTAEYYQHGSIYIKPRAVGEATLFVEIDGLKAQTQVVVTDN